MTDEIVRPFVDEDADKSDLLFQIGEHRHGMAVWRAGENIVLALQSGWGGEHERYLDRNTALELAEVIRNYFAITAPAPESA